VTETDDLELARTIKIIFETKGENTMANKKENDQSREKQGFFSKIFGSSKGKSCCDVKIVPKDEPDELQKDEGPVRGEEQD